jgi:hypothetical protein
MRRFVSYALFVFPFVLPLLLQGQNPTTSLHGTLKDPSGAVVLQGDVRLDNSEIGVHMVHRVDATGEYQFSQLIPARYVITVTSPGFASQSKQAELVVNQPATVDFTLAIQASATVVDVSAETATLNTTDATIGNAIGSQVIEAVPLEGRNVPDLLSLQPGVVFLGRMTTTQQDTDSRSGAVDGGRSDQSNITLDGVDNNDQTKGYAFTGILRSTVDSVDEFRVVTTNSNADSGRSSGAQVSIVTKSGTNQLHGAVYEYLRNTLTAANDWFNKQAQLASGRPNVPGELIRNTFGAAVGGPVKKDKLFFFLNYEGQRTAENQQVTQVVPTALLREGYVQYPHTSNGQTANVVLSPAEIAGMDPNCTANGTCPWGPGDNPNMLAIMAQYPLPNGFNAGDGLNTLSYTFSSPNPQSLDTYIARFDWQLGDRHRLFARGNLQKDHTAGTLQFPDQAPSSNLAVNSKGVAVGDTWTIGATLVNDLRYGLTREGYGNLGTYNGPYVGFFGTISSFDPVTRSSILKVPVHNIVDNVSWVKGKHGIEAGVNYRLITSDSNSNAVSFSNAYIAPAWLDNGAIANTGSSLDPAAFGYPAVDSAFGIDYDQAVSSLTGLLPEISSQYNYQISQDGKTGQLLGQGTYLDRKYRTNEFEYFLQDSYRVLPNLTLNFGMRHTLLQSPYEMNGQQIAPAIDMHQWFTTREQMAALGQTVQPDVAFAPSGQARGLKPYWNAQRWNIAPRLSVAYSPDVHSGLMHRLFGGQGQSSIRAGFGLYFDHFGQGIVNSFDQMGAFGLSTNITTPAGLYTVDNVPRLVSGSTLPPAPVLPSTITYPYTASNDPFSTGYSIAWGLDNHLQTPYAEVMDFSLQRELPGGFTLEAAYVGRLGRHLLQQLDLAQPLDLVDPGSGVDYFTAATQFAKYADLGVPANAVQKIPYWENLFPDAAGLGASGTGTPGASATQNMYSLFKSLRGTETFALEDADIYCIPGCGGQTGRYWSKQFSALYSWASMGTSNYNGGQLMLRHAMSHGLQMDFSYTLSKSLDLGSSAERTTQQNLIYTGGIINSKYPNLNYGVSDFDIRHLITSNWVYLLPVGHGQKFANGVRSWVNGVVGGWQFSGLGRWTSGLPFGSVDGVGWTTDYANKSNMVPIGPIATHRHIQANGAPQVFADPTAALANLRFPYPGEAGTRAPFRGDGYFSIDSSLAKSWSLGERAKLRFGWDVFNVTNSVRFDTNTNTNISGSLNTSSTAAGSFGVYSSELTTPRVQQFYLRVSF